jgi:hypothetical protein
MITSTPLTRIGFRRQHLAEVCKLGFQAERVGADWVTGWLPTERLPLMQVTYYEPAIQNDLLKAK